MATKTDPPPPPPTPAAAPSCTCPSKGWTVKGTLADLLRKGDFSDLVFLVGDEKVEVKAHQLLLVTRSEVFRTMFQDRWISPSQGQGGEALRIPLSYVSEPAFRQFLKYFYTDELDLMKTLPLDDALEVLDLSHMYEVPGMVEACCGVLVERIDVSSSLEIFMKAKSIGIKAKTLEDKAFWFILSHLKEVFGREQFLELNADTVEQFMKVDSLAVREVQLVGALVRWAEHQGISKDEICKNPVTLKLVKLIRACQLESESSGPDAKNLLSQEIMFAEEYDNHQILLFIRTVLSSHLDWKSNNYRSRKVKMSKVTLYRGTGQDRTVKVASISEPKEEFRLRRHFNKLVFVNSITLHPFQHQYLAKDKKLKVPKLELGEDDLQLEICIMHNSEKIRSFKVKVKASSPENDAHVIKVSPPVPVPREGDLKFMVRAVYFFLSVVPTRYRSLVESALIVKSGILPSSLSGRFPLDKDDNVHVGIGFPENDEDFPPAKFIKSISCSYNIDPEPCTSH